MAFFSPETTVTLKHLLGNFAAALLLFAVAIGLGFVEKWCETQKLPAHLTNGVMVVSFVLFAIDAIMICGAAAIAAIKLLKRAWINESEH